MHLDKAHALTAVCLLLFMGAMGKSAQFLLHTWLPDAMEGPTPISALIHAATMVTAGVFMVARMSPLFELSTTALTSFVTVLGAITAFFAAHGRPGAERHQARDRLFDLLAARLHVRRARRRRLRRGDLPPVHARLLQGAAVPGAGSVIHAMHHEQDMRNMGGLRKYIPITYWMMMIGTLALTGVGIPAPYRHRRLLLQGRDHRIAFVGHIPAAGYAFWPAGDRRAVYASIPGG
jgi:NADH-quinone oxidoreductase subunit L